MPPVELKCYLAVTLFISSSVRHQNTTVVVAIVEETAAVLLIMHGTKAFAHSTSCFIDDLMESEVLGDFTLILASKSGSTCSCKKSGMCHNAFIGGRVLSDDSLCFSMSKNTYIRVVCHIEGICLIL